MSPLPVDILSDILVRLPAKSLLRFKSVCKLWYALINDPDFINRHVEQSNLHMIFTTPIVYLSDFDTFDNPTHLNYPFKDMEFKGFNVCGSCRGLLCLSMLFYPYTIFLYNPTTQSYRTLPFLPTMSTFRYPKEGSQYMAVGYDHVAEDYKVVKINMRSVDDVGGSFKSQVMVYSLKADYWKRGAHDVPFYFDCESLYSVVLNGICHWAGGGDPKAHPPIVAFNFIDETFSSMSLPNCRLETYMRANLGVVDSSLCLMLDYLSDCEVWLMKEYGVATSWTRFYTISNLDRYFNMRPLSLSKCRKKLFVIFTLANVASLDLETMKLTYIKPPGFLNLMDAHVCVENLLMLKDDDVYEGTQHCQRGTKRKLFMRKTKRFLAYYGKRTRAFTNGEGSLTSNGES